MLVENNQNNKKKYYSVHTYVLPEFWTFNKRLLFFLIKKRVICKYFVNYFGHNQHQPFIRMRRAEVRENKFLFLAELLRMLTTTFVKISDQTRLQLLKYANKWKCFVLFQILTFNEVYFQNSLSISQVILKINCLYQTLNFLKLSCEATNWQHYFNGLISFNVKL